jgi:hypothetical protein
MNQHNQGFFVAKSRQKAPENGFQKRARLKREAEEARAEVRAAKVDPIGPPPYPPRPTPPPVPGVDLDAMKAAAAEAAALIHSEPAPLTLDTLIEEAGDAGPGHDAEVEQPEPKRGRPLSAAVAKRNATILQLLAENPEGLSKSQLATELEEKEANVYTSLRRLQSDGKIRTENTEGTKYLWYLV